MVEGKEIVEKKLKNDGGRDDERKTGKGGNYDKTWMRKTERKENKGEEKKI